MVVISPPSYAHHANGEVLLSLWLLLVIPWLCHQCSSSSAATITSPQHFDNDVVNGESELLYENLLQELQHDAQQQRKIVAFVVHDPTRNRDEDAVAKAANEFSPYNDNKHMGRAAWTFLSGLASSSIFVQQYWHQRPLLIRDKAVTAVSFTKTERETSPKSWVAGAFTVEEHLRMVEDSYITGFRTPERLRNGSDTSSWSFDPILATTADGGGGGGGARSEWSTFEQALRGGTIYFNAAGSLWPTLGALCRLTQYAFGVPANVNVYATPANVNLSVPPHTDRQDVLVFQTAGTKHWRVYAPLKISQSATTLDPMDRGKHGDSLTAEELGAPLLDVVLRPGDVLYVPIGFPHTTDTSNYNHSKNSSNNPDGESDDDIRAFNQTSVHLTMGLDTQIWCLTWEHLRSTVLQRSGKDASWKKKANDPTSSTSNDDSVDARFWALAEALPIGFLGGEHWRRSWKRILRSQRRPGTTATNNNGVSLDPEFRNKVIHETKQLLVRIEPNRWKSSSDHDVSVDDGAPTSRRRHRNRKETIPSDQEIGAVVDFIFGQHLLSILLVQQEFFTDIDPHDEQTGIKAFLALHRNNIIMEQFATFSKNEAMRSHYAQKRMAAEAMFGGFM